MLEEHLFEVGRWRAVPGFFLMKYDTFHVVPLLWQVVVVSVWCVLCVLCVLHVLSVLCVLCCVCGVHIVLCVALSVICVLCVALSVICVGRCEGVGA